MINGIRLVRALWALFICHVVLFGKLFLLKGFYVVRGLHGTLKYVQAFTLLQTRYATELFDRLCTSLSIDVQVDDEAVRRACLSGPLILVSNHQSSIDVLITYWLLARYQLSQLYWLLKFGTGQPHKWACEETRGALLGRDGREEDHERVRRTGRDAHQDGAIAAVYPEGHRFDPSRVRQGSRFTQLLDPHFKGLELLCETMPTAPIVWVDFRWSGGTRAFNARSLGGLPRLLGKQLEIRVRLVPRSEVGDPKTWLLNNWEEREAWHLSRAREEARQAVHQGAA